MCNLYNVSPKEEVERHFRVVVKAGGAGEEAYPQAPVGPFGRGLFIRAAPAAATGDDESGREAVIGQWGMVPPRSKQPRPAGRAILTNNARIESVAERPTYRDAWLSGRRCLIPAQSYQEPNWETGRNIWWPLRRADGLPWALAGIWSEWQHPETGELIPNYSMLTLNCDAHPLLNRLHKPDPALPPDAQDKRAVMTIRPEDWQAWLRGSVSEAQALLAAERLPAPEAFDLGPAEQTDALLARLRKGPPQGSLF
jgi:putative SOS response-associated peptidase YedK